MQVNKNNLLYLILVSVKFYLNEQKQKKTRWNVHNSESKKG
jgi:hypothetical protein